MESYSLTVNSAFARLLVFRNGSIGNTLAAFPALRCLAASYPDTRITIVVDPVGKELMQNAPFAHEIIVYDRHGLDRGGLGFLRTARRLRNLAPDAAILFKRFFRNGLLARLSGAEQRYGFSTDGSAPFLNATVPYDESVHVAALNLRLVNFIGAITETELSADLYLTEQELLASRRYLFEHGVGVDYVVCHFGGITSGAGYVSLELRKRIVQFAGKDRVVVLIGSGPRESADARQLAIECPGAVDLTNLPMRLTMSIISEASAFVGTNSGPMHIAAAARICGVALYRQDERFAVERVKWSPLFEGLKVVAISPSSPTESSFDALRAAWPQS